MRRIVNWCRSYVRSNAASAFALPYALVLLAGCLSWLFWYQPGGMPRDGRVYASAVAEALTVFALYLLLDSHVRGRVKRFLLAGLAALLVAYCIVDAFLLWLTDIRLHHSLTILQTGGDFWLALSLAGFTLQRIVQILLIVPAAIVLGGLLHAILPRFQRVPAAGKWTLLALAVLAPAFFVAEQAASRPTALYQVRGMIYPAYWQIFAEGPQAFTTMTQGRTFSGGRQAALQGVGHPRHPYNVLYVLLESVRADAQCPQVMPHLYALAAEGVDCRQGMAAGGFTHVSWNTLLLDRPGFTVWLDQTSKGETSGSWPLQVLKQAGYEVDLSISTLFDYKGFRRRVCGSGHLVDHYFQGASFGNGADIEPAFLPKWSSLEADEKALGQAITRLDERPGDKPFFLLVQFDGTHFPYEFDPQLQLEGPCADESQFGNYATPDYVTLMHNRYLNSVRQMDARIGRLIEALKTRGLYDNTVIVVTSDHGETFLPHRVGHGPLEENTRRVPLVMKLPGVSPQQVHTFVRHQDIWPTILAQLDIPGVHREWFLGEPFLTGNEPEAALTIHGSTRLADLTTPTLVYRFRLKYTLEEVTFIPMGILDRDGNAVDTPPEAFAARIAQLRPVLTRLAGYEPPQPMPENVPVSLNRP